ncbi:MAG: type I-E CRISPR-associated protein Cas6/Cse3/CasE [Treponema sp.]|nr:type I-E CRISPR-associated protein Cas6/Cse3/CasE [Treponema sp.]
MIASVLTLSFSDCKAHRITDPYSVHRTVYSLFPKTDEGGRDFLFADKGGGFNRRRILILSKRRPLRPEYGSIESREIPKSFLEGNCYGFEIRLNPVKREKGGGKIVPVRGRENLLEWFRAKSESWGFAVDRESQQIQSSGIQSFEKQDRQVTQNAATFTGILKVKDRPLFIKSFEEGIGRGKSFGFGLLEIVPLREQHQSR